MTSPTPETRILSLLRPADMLRFVLVPNGEQKVDVGIEGCAAHRSGNPLLAERIALLLDELRLDGYAFGDKSRRLESRTSFAAGKGEGHAAPAWVEIRPRLFTCVPAPIEPLGFGAAGSKPAAEPRLLLPELPASRDARALASPAKLLAALPQVEWFEIEFIRMELPEAATKVLEDARLRLQNMAGQSTAPVDLPALPQMFLAGWLWHRSGWRVTVRVRLRRGGGIPVAPLEMIGRDLFTSECEVITSRTSQAPNGHLDLRNAYPRGWPFPPILPSPAAFETLAASRLHNVNLPEVPRKGLKIGVAERTEIFLPPGSRDCHTYIVGATGTGKSTLLARMIHADMLAGEGVIALDPHGDLLAEMIQAVPESRRGDLLIIDPTRKNGRPGLNIFDIPHGPFQKRHAELLIGELLQCFREIWNIPEAFGPCFELYFRNAVQLLTLRKGEPMTVASFNRVFTDREFRSRLVQECADPFTASFWKDLAERAGGDYSLSNMTPYIACKMGPLTQGTFLTGLLNQPRDEVRLADRINQSPIILVNLNKGVLGVQESRILGVILMAQIMGAGLKRSLMSPRKRRPVNIYVDEFQNFVSDNVASMLSEARKFGLRLTLANQTLAQLRANFGRQDLLETVLGNVGNVILFRLGVPDADKLKLFTEPFTPQEMQELPNFHALVRLLTPEGPVRPLILKTLAPEPKTPQRLQRVRDFATDVASAGAR